MKELAPIVLFAYNRPDHTLETLRALSNNDLADESTLYIFVDGLKEHSSSEEHKLSAILKEEIRKQKWCGTVEIEEKTENWGLANSIVEGITRIVKKHGKVIVLEDDTVPQKGFLKFMNEALVGYQDNQQVMHISGYTYPYDYSLCKDQTYFSKILSCWGWATWEDRWNNYSADVDHFLSKFSSKEAKAKFDIEGNANYYEQLVLNKNWRINSWAVKWYASWLLQGGTTLFPHKSLIKNIGQDGTGVHKDDTSIFQSECVEYVSCSTMEVKEHQSIRKSIDLFYKNEYQKKIGKRHVSYKSKLKSGIKKITVNPLKKVFYKIFPELRQQDKPVVINSKLSGKATIYPLCQIRDSSVEDYTYISENARLNKTTVGKFTSIGPNLICGWGIHPLDLKSTSPMFYSTKKQNGFSLVQYDRIKEQKRIKIGHDVFIGMNVIILDGVEIGDGAVIGAGCVVSKDVPPYAIVAGNPMKIIRYRFDEEKIKQLLEEKWWNHFDFERINNGDDSFNLLSTAKGN